MLSYPQLLASTFPPTLREPEQIRLPDEISLQAIWFNGQFGREFLTTDGRSVRIRQFGFWNRAAGPDFLHASVEINGEVHTGPLELDTHSSDWEAHGHDTNPAFNEVILHVVFLAGSHTHFTRTENHREVPKVILPEEVVQSALQTPRYATATASIGRCFTPLEKLPKDSILRLMQEAAKHRCSNKAKRLQSIIESHSRDQALWIALAETLGYHPNKQTMTQLAQRLPIHYLSQNTQLSAPLIFGTAGFLHPEIHEQAPIESQQWLQELWETWWKHRGKHELAEERAIQWIRSGIRPINHPQRRLAALALIAKHWPTFRKLATQSDTLIEWLESLHDDFWSHHYTLTSKRSEKKLALIGKDRIRDLLINHLLPLRIKNGDPIAWNQYLKFPAPAISEPVNRASTRLFGERPDKKDFMKYAWQHQALLQIYNDFCLEDDSDCKSCPFPEQLLEI